VRFGIARLTDTVACVRDEFLVFGKPDIRSEEIAEVVDSLESGWIGTGPKVRRFEELLAEYVEASYVRCVSSCTAALFLALRTHDIGPGDEVIVPTMTFVASANVVEHVGATPVFVDAEPSTGLVDLDAVEAAVGPRSKAFIPVHLAGRPVDLDRLNALRDRRGLLVIEDAAHAIGARWRGRPVGSFGNPTAFSFYATKNVTTGEGGALAVDSEELAGRVEQLALHGLSLGAWQRFSDSGYRHYDATQPGFKFNLTDLAAALGIHQLRRLDEGIAIREWLWHRYDELLAPLPLETPPQAASEMHHARHLYQVLLTGEWTQRRDEVLDGLTKRRIGAGVHYRAVHLHPFYAETYGLRPEQFPVATDISERTISLPLGSNVSERDQDDVVAALVDILSS
jgi:dTDP-4-amino-4,6-dideoxygalactose transaminase